jgi:hypothetical protein
MAGKSPYLQAVQFETDAHRVGDVVAVKIERAGSNSLFGALESGLLTAATVPPVAGESLTAAA